LTIIYFSQRGWFNHQLSTHFFGGNLGIPNSPENSQCFPEVEFAIGVVLDLIRNAIQEGILSPETVEDWERRRGDSGDVMLRAYVALHLID